MKWLRTNREPERGQALVEFALVSIVFFIFVFGMIDGGFGDSPRLTSLSRKYESSRSGSSANPTASR